MAKKPATKKAEDQPSLFDEPTPPPDPEAAAPAPPPAPAIDPALVPANFPADWLAAVGTEFTQPYFADLRKFVSEERKQFDIFPPAPDVFNAFRFTPLSDVRCVILGQDPYPTPGNAHGLCFSVRPGVPVPASLRNMYIELQDDLGLPPVKHGYLEAWARQGVLLLNTVMTVRSGVPKSHKGKGWERFTDAAIRAVNDLPRRVVFLLWGSDAKAKVKVLDGKKHAVITGVHPSPLSASNGFFGSKPFSKVNAALEASGQKPIDWQLPATV